MLTHRKIIIFLLVIVLIYVFTSCTLTVEDSSSTDNGKEDSTITIVQETSSTEGDNILEVNVDKPENPQKNIVDASVFGMSTENDDNTEALATALAYCSLKTDGVTLVIPKGTYYFNSEKFIQLRNLKDVLIDAQGSTFIYSNVGMFQIRNSERIEFQNLYIDWDWDKQRLGSIAEVVNVSNDNTYYDFKFPELSNVDENIKWWSLNQYDPQTLTPGVENGKEFFQARLNFNKVEKIGDNVLRVYPKDRNLGFKTGEVYMLRHLERNHYHAFNIIESSHITLNNITIYSARGNGIVVLDGSHHVKVIDCNITLRPDTNRRLSTYADGFHATNTKGYFLIENCDFSFMGDDAVNINDMLGVGIVRIDDNHFKISGRMPVDEGDVLEFRNFDLSPTGFESEVIRKISNVDREDNWIFIVELKGTIPENIKDNSLVFNKKYNSGNYIIRNNNFHENRARGLLLQSSNGIVENNRFYKTQGAAILITLDIHPGKWQEGTGLDNLVVRNNTFDTCNVNDWGPIIQFKARLPQSNTSYPIFTNVIFENNEFINFPSEAFLLTVSSDITIRNNVFRNNAERIINKPERGTIRIENSSSISIYENIWYKSPFVKDPGKLIVKNSDYDTIMEENNELKE